MCSDHVFHIHSFFLSILLMPYFGHQVSLSKARLQKLHLYSRLELVKFQFASRYQPVVLYIDLFCPVWVKKPNMCLCSHLHCSDTSLCIIVAGLGVVKETYHAAPALYKLDNWS
jgi:hypothetical protein